MDSYHIKLILLGIIFCLAYRFFITQVRFLNQTNENLTHIPEPKFPISETESVQKPTSENQELYIHKSISPLLLDSLSKRYPANLIGIGVKKCGTGAFRDYLKRHPDVKIHIRYESNFFTGKFYGKIKYNIGKHLAGQPNLKDKINDTLLLKYLNEFDGPNSADSKIIYGMSPNYFIDEVVPPNIQKYYTYYNQNLHKLPGTRNPIQPIFLIVLCDPVNRIFSDYHHILHTTQGNNNSLWGSNILKYKNFDNFIDINLPILENMQLEKSEVDGNFDLFTEVKNDNSVFERTIITASFYDLLIERFRHSLAGKNQENLKNLGNMDQFILVNGDNLVKRPWEEMSLFINKFNSIRRKQFERLNLEFKNFSAEYFTRDKFQLNHETGFYCYKSDCLGSDKNRKILGVRIWI